MNIAICDNNKIILRKLVSLIEDYAEFKHIDLTYSTFTNYEDILKQIDDFDLFILDYNMNDDSIRPDSSKLLTGMDFAKILRSKANPHKGIIFLTSYTEIVYEAFEVRTHRFLIKPIEKEKLFKALEDFISSTVESGTIFIKTHNETHVIDISSIYYFEVILKDVFIHFKDSTIKCHKTISEFEKELIPFGFFRTHRSYLVNVKKIKSITSRTAVMDNGDEVYVSIKKYSELCEQFLDND